MEDGACLYIRMQRCPSKCSSLICSQSKVTRMYSSQDALISTENHQLHPSIDKLILTVRMCTKERNFACALCVCAYVQENIPEAHLLLGKHMVPMFVEAGSVHDARNVFDRLGLRNEHCWNSLVNGYLQNEMMDQAFLIYSKMQQDFVYISGFTFVALLKICTKLKDMVKGKGLHADIAKSGLLRKDLFVGSTLVDMYTKCGLLGSAQDVFDNLPIKNVVSWNALIGGYAKHDCGEEALELLERMQMEDVSPNIVTYICCLKACGSIEAIDRGREIHCEIMRRRLLAGVTFIGNALVDMYAKCGSFSKAQEVFDGLLHQDVASWNALMTGFLKHEHGEEALNCFKRMQKDGVSPDVITYACSLKACGIIEDIEEGETLHAEVEMNGLLTQHPVLGNALVDMYGKCGLLEKAQEVFDKLPTHDLVSWNALVSGYAKYELDQEALNCFEQMQIEGISPDSITFACSLKACGNMGLIDEGRKIHADINQKGFLVEDVVVGNALVSMYANCGYLGKAWEVFEVLPHPSTVSWNAMIAGHIRQDCGEEALRCLRQMQEEGVPPSAITYACGLKACGSIGAMDQGKELHAEIARKGLLERDVSLRGSLVDMYMKGCLLEHAQEVFDVLAHHDLVSWNVLIAGYVNHECGELALLCFEEMQSEGVMPDAATFACLFKACGSTGSVSQGLEMHAEIERRELLREDEVASNALVDMYGKCGLLEKAHEVFKKLPVRSVVSWSALITGYAKHEEGERALDFYKQMQLEGIAPDVITLACILKACGSITATCKGQEVHAEIERKGLLASDVLVGNSLVDMYAKCGCLTLAYDLFDKLPLRDVVSWNALIAGNSKYGLSEAVLDSFEQMQAEGILPDEVSFVCSLKACVSVGTACKGKEMHARIEKHEILERDLLVGNAVVDMYAKGGFVEEAQGVFDKLPKKSIVTWNALIAGYAQLGLNDVVLDKFVEMVEREYKPDPATFTSFLNVCAHTGLAHKAATFFCAMSQDHSITPTIDHLNCIVDLLGCAGQLESALAIMEQLPSHPDVVVSSAVLGACRKWGNVELGRQVFEEFLSWEAILWNVLIAGYVQQGEIEQALKCFKQVQSEIFYLDAVTFRGALEACGSAGAHADYMVAKALTRKGTAYVVGTPSEDEAADPDYEDDREKEDETPRKKQATNIMSIFWESRMQWLASNLESGAESGNQSPTIILGSNGLHPTLGMVLNLGNCHRKWLHHAEGELIEPMSSDIGKAGHKDVGDTGFTTHTYVQNSLLTLYNNKWGGIAKFESMFARLPRPSLVSGNAMLSAYADHGQKDMTTNRFRQMLAETEWPSEPTFTIVICGCGTLAAKEQGTGVKQSKRVAQKAGEALHSNVQRRGVALDDYVGNTLVSMYGKCGKVLEVGHVIMDLSE